MTLKHTGETATPELVPIRLGLHEPTVWAINEPAPDPYSQG